MAGLATTLSVLVVSGTDIGRGGVGYGREDYPTHALVEGKPVDAGLDFAQLCACLPSCSVSMLQSCRVACRIR